jgi:F420-non-reducing hydrogenase small subunit
VPPVLKKEGPVKVAFISLSTCGGCLAVLLEEQDELTKLLNRTNISYCPRLMDHDKISEVEVAIVDGVVRVEEDEEKLREARRKSRYMVTWGTCATFGGIPAMANQYDLEELIEESYGQALDPFAYYLSGAKGVDPSTYQEKDLALLRRAGKLDDLVKVDYYLPGCPPQLSLLTHVIKELRGESQVARHRKIVCAECGRKPPKIRVEDFWVLPRSEWAASHCFSSGGSLCMGFVTKGGCGAVCPRNGLGCWGCRGPSEAVQKKIGRGDTFQQVVLSALSRRCRLAENKIKPAVRTVQRRGKSALSFDPSFMSVRTSLR